VKFAAMIAAAAVILLLRRAWAKARRRAFIETFEFPEGLRKKFREARPGLTLAQEGLIFDALRQYFQVCRRAGTRFVSMPSQAVDDAWHAFILFTRGYERFCRRAFGRFLHHTPAEAMTSPTLATEGIRRAWRHACALERIDPKTPARLPLLFAVDQTLGLSDGFRYALNCEPGRDTYCASHIGCGSGCGGGDGGDGGDGGSCGGGD
jgi:hypothetical protein